MRKTILALATAGALAGTALPALAWDRDDDYGNYRHRYYHSDYDRPYHRRYDYDDYRRPYREHHWWWRRHHYRHDYDRPYYRRYY
jgi:hypothetical protein